MAKRKRRTYRRRRRTGLMGISTSKLSMKNATGELIDIVLIGAGAVAASKGVGMLDGIINKSGTKMMGFIAPAVVTVAGVAGAMLLPDKAKGLGKGIAMGGAVKLVEKAINKENLLSGTDDEPLMMPGIGSYGMAELPELNQYSENPDADVTTTGNDPQYYMGQPAEVLSGDDDEAIAF